MATFIDDIKQRYKLATVVERMIYLNIALFVFIYLLKAIAFLMQWDSNPIFEFFALPANFELYIKKFWTLISYGFLHDGFWHLFFNMLLLYFLGRLFLDFFSRKQFLTYYLLGIVAGGVIFLASYNLFPALKSTSTFLVGASAGVTAIVIGLAAKIPNYAIHFRFIGAIKLWYIAAAMVLIDVVQIPLGNTGGRLAHLGGGLLGFLLTKQFNDGKVMTNFFSNLFTRKKQKPLKTVYKRPKTTSGNSKNEHQERIDAILDKISKSGYDSLTQNEKDFLFSAGKK